MKRNWFFRWNDGLNAVFQRGLEEKTSDYWLDNTDLEFRILIGGIGV